MLQQVLFYAWFGAQKPRLISYPPVLTYVLGAQKNRLIERGDGSFEYQLHNMSLLRNTNVRKLFFGTHYYLKAWNSHYLILRWVKLSNSKFPISVFWWNFMLQMFSQLTDAANIQI